MGQLTTIYALDHLPLKGVAGWIEDIALADDDIIIDEYFPELEQCRDLHMMVIPLSGQEIISKLPRLKGKTIITCSEVVILWFLREIRKGRMEITDLKLHSGHRRIRVGINGEMIDPWTGEFFGDTFSLRYC